MKLRPGNPEEAGMSPVRIRHVADLARGWVDGGITPTLVVLVARRGVIVLHEAFGRLTPDADAPPLPRDAIFPLMSISKPITATAVMILVEEGRIGLNRPVVEYIPEFNGDGKEAVLVHHLLTHTSGLRDEDVEFHSQKVRGSIVLPPLPVTQHPIIHDRLVHAYQTPLAKAPGLMMSYCSFGYDLLGEIIRRVSGQSLASFCEQRIFTLLAMHDTSYILPESAKNRIVRRPANDQFAWLNDLQFYTTPSAGGGVQSTALDMAIFAQMMLNRGYYHGARLLSPTTVAAMTRNQIPGLSAEFLGEFLPEAGWGLGWDIHGSKKALNDGALLSTQTFSHGGGGGVRLWVDPFYEIVGVYFSVGVQTVATGRRPSSPMDLFMNAVMAAVID